MRRDKEQLRADLAQCAELGLCQNEAAARMGLSPAYIGVLKRRFGIELPSGVHRKQPDERSRMMAALYREGYTLKQIGEQYGITRERVRQIITKLHGLRQPDGGATVRAEKGRQCFREARDARYLAKWGLPYQEVAEIRQLARKLMASGVAWERTPIGAFVRQRVNARWRDIPWELSFAQWWGIWRASGKWEQRGRGQGYVMCRQGDVGPYAVGNVFIASARENTSSGTHKKSELPIGVAKKKGGFIARRCINGQALNLGVHPTPELAYAAYLAAAA